MTPRIGQQSFFLKALSQSLEIVDMRLLDSDPNATGHGNIFSSPAVLTDLAYTLNDVPNPYRKPNGANIFDLHL